MRLLRRTARAALVGLSLAFATACSDSTGLRNPEGVYTLTSVDNEPLPVIIEQTSFDRTEIVEGYIELDQSGRYTDVIVYGITTNDGFYDEELDQATGSYEVSSGRVYFYPDQGQAYDMAWSGNALTQTFGIVGGSATFRYTK